MVENDENKKDNVNLKDENKNENINVENSELPKVMQIKKKENDNDNNKEEVISKKNNNKFKKFYIIFIMVLTVITGIATYFTIKYIDASIKPDNEIKEEIAEEETKEVVKKKAEDEKYALTKYSETYNENDLIFNYDSGILQIDGLKDKDVQNKINTTLKEKANSLKSNKRVETRVNANFSNVLGVTIYGYDNYIDDTSDENLNIDLSTGNEIPFEDLFVSSASINSILSEGMYKTLAWEIKNKNTNEDNWEEDFDMSKVNTSDFEDKSLLLAKRYEKEKGKIKYSLYFDKIYVYGLLDGIAEKNNEAIRIDLVNHIENLAIYKRFLTKESLFENSDIGLKDIIVCEYPLAYGVQDVKKYKALNLGFISDNVYMEDFFEFYIKDEDENAIKKITNYLQSLSNDTKKSLKNNLDKGMIFQRSISLSKSRNEAFYCVNLIENTTTCSIDYFKDLAFKDYIKVKIAPRVEDSIFKFSNSEYARKMYPNLKLTDEVRKEIYFNLDGEYLGDNEEEAKRKTISNDEDKPIENKKTDSVDNNNNSNITPTNTNNVIEENTNITNNTEDTNITNTNNISNTTDNSANNIANNTLTNQN